MGNHEYSKDTTDYFELLDVEGNVISIDRANSPFEMALPEYYDKKKFQMAQNFFLSNLCAVSSGHIIGTIAVLAIPSILNVISFTQKSSVPKTAYKRYVETILHIRAWYRCELKPGSESWKSLEAVRRQHVFASRSAEKHNAGKIHQQNLALAQMCLIAYVVIRPESLGVQVSREGFEAYVHYWRVIGHMIGIEDRFNVCTDALATTRPRLEYFLNEMFRPALENPPEHFYTMARAALDGLWYYNPMINTPSFIYLLKHMSNCSGYVYYESDLEVLDHGLGECRQNIESMKWFDRFMLFFLMTFHRYLLNFWTVRWFYNILLIVISIVHDKLPLLAIYGFGQEWAHVDIFKRKKLKPA